MHTIDETFLKGKREEKRERQGWIGIERGKEKRERERERERGL